MGLEVDVHNEISQYTAILTEQAKSITFMNKLKVCNMYVQ